MTDIHATHRPEVRVRVLASMATTDQTSSGTATSSALAFGDGKRDGDTVADTYVPWSEYERRARRRRIIVSAAAACALLAAVLGAVVWNANVHYARGRDMLARGRYATAVEEFAAARVFALPYRDAAALGATAERSVAAATAAAAADRRLRATVTRLLEKADEKLAQGDAAGVLAAVGVARRVVPDGPLPVSTESAGLTTRLALHIKDVAERDLAGARWGPARSLAMALSSLQPGSADASRLLAEARSGAALQAKLVRARAAAAAGHWRTARRLALAVLDARKGFPGAAAVVAQATAALAPKPKPTPTRAATSAATNSSPPASTPAAPPPPP